ncbi:MAG: hypothetical protein HQ498_14585 [Pseudohongiella sp.]|jgi:hypothetical protein|nr:hypothetical protein [Pseudohongiella sp.]
MKLNAIKFGTATAIGFALIWLLCSVLVWIQPSLMMGMSGHMVHGDFSTMDWHMTSAGVVTGLFAWSIIAGLSGALIATVYNKLI